MKLNMYVYYYRFNADDSSIACNLITGHYLSHEPVLTNVIRIYKR